MLRTALGGLFRCEQACGERLPLLEGLATARGEMGLSEGTPCLGFMQTCNAKSSHPCHHHQQPELAALLEGRSASPFHSALARELPVCSHLPLQEVLAGGMDSPGERLLSSTLAADISHPLAAYRWWFAQVGFVGPEDSNVA